MRLGGKKVRTGCRTCKIRRVKCDEEKPYCNRCRSTGRKCDGYQFESSALATRLAHSVAVELPGTRRERKAFDFFYSCTAASICGYFPDQFWERNVLQASFSQPCLRHAAVAVGSLHESLSRDLMAGGPRDVRDNLFALRQYSKAITHLSGSLSKNKHYSTVALMCCILFVAFDTLLDQSDLAIAHLRSGLEILRNHDSAEIDLFHDIFARMSITSFIYMGSKPSARPLFAWELPNPHYHNPPAKFASLFEARNCLNSIHESMFRSFMYPTGLSGTSGGNMYPSMSSDVQGPQDTSNLSTAALKMKYITALQRWSHAFEAFLRDPSLCREGGNLRGALLLKIHQCMSMITVSTDLSEYRPSYEAFAAGFETIIDLGEALVKTEVQAHRLLCSPAMGIIGPLCYTALNSPSEHIHRRAMELLAIPRREGMFDNRRAVALAAKSRELRRNSGASAYLADPPSRASSEEYLGEYPNSSSGSKCLLTADDWNTAIWDVFPALAPIRPRGHGPAYSNEFMPAWGEVQP